MYIAIDNGKTLCPGEIDAHLRAGLSCWRHEGGFIRRTYRTNDWKSTLMVVNAIGHLAEAAWHHPDVCLSYDRVEVSLQSHDAGGVTVRDIELAQKIEEMILWRPGADRGSALEGAPEDDPRFAYIKYD